MDGVFGASLIDCVEMLLGPGAAGGTDETVDGVFGTSLIDCVEMLLGPGAAGGTGETADGGFGVSLIVCADAEAALCPGTAPFPAEG